MNDEELKNAAKAQQSQIKQLLRFMTKTLKVTRERHGGRCTAAHIDYDEQDVYNAVTIMHTVGTGYAIKHGVIDAGNAAAKGRAMKEAVREIFGVDTAQEACVAAMATKCGRDS